MTCVPTTAATRSRTAAWAEKRKEENRRAKTRTATCGADDRFLSSACCARKMADHERRWSAPLRVCAEINAQREAWRRLSVCRVETRLDARPDESGRCRHECLRHV